MKCSNAECGLSGQGNFCQSCGSEMKPDTLTGTFIICRGKLNDVPCGAEIVPLQKFCTKCGAKVDQSLFAVTLESCKRCGTVLGPECLFCAQCGLPKTSDTSQEINDGTEVKNVDNIVTVDSAQSVSEGGDSQLHSDLNTTDIDAEKPSQDEATKDNISTTPTVQPLGGGGDASNIEAVTAEAKSKMIDANTNQLKDKDTVHVDSDLKAVGNTSNSGDNKSQSEIEALSSEGGSKHKGEEDDCSTDSSKDGSDKNDRTVEATNANTCIKTADEQTIVNDDLHQGTIMVASASLNEDKSTNYTETVQTQLGRQEEENITNGSSGSLNDEHNSGQAEHSEAVGNTSNSGDNKSQSEIEALSSEGGSKHKGEEEDCSTDSSKDGSDKNDKTVEATNANTCIKTADEQTIVNDDLHQSTFMVASASLKEDNSTDYTETVQAQLGRQEEENITNGSRGSLKDEHNSGQAEHSEESQVEHSGLHAIFDSIDGTAGHSTSKEAQSELLASIHNEKKEDQEETVFQEEVSQPSSHTEMVGSSHNSDNDDTENMQSLTERVSQKRKHSGGGSKAKTEKKRDRKRKSHSEKYGLSADPLKETSGPNPTEEQLREGQDKNKSSTSEQQEKEENVQMSFAKGDSLESDKTASSASNETLVKDTCNLKNSMPENDAKVFGEPENRKLTSSQSESTSSSDITWPPNLPEKPTCFSSTVSGQNTSGSSTAKEEIPIQELRKTDNADANEEPTNKGVPEAAQTDIHNDNEEKMEVKRAVDKEKETESDRLNNNEVKIGKGDSASSQNAVDQGKKNKNAKNQAAQNGKSNKNKNEISGNVSVDGKITVRFHALVSEDFHIETGDKVVVRIALPEYGGWENLNHVLKRVGHMNGYIKMEIDLKVRKTDLGRYRYYKYGIVRANPKDKKKAFTYEYHHVKSGHDTFHNRTLYITQSVLSGIDDIWHQYDGIISPKHKDNILKRGYKYWKGTYEKECQKDAERFAKLHCPDWFKPDNGNSTETISVEESISKLQSLFLGLRKTYYVDVGCWDNEDGFNKMMDECILAPVIQQLQTFEYTSGTFNIAFLKALTIAIFCERVELVLPMEELQIICKCLLVHPTGDDTECVELKVIQQDFLDRKMLQKPLEYLIQCVTATRKNPSWMFCLPLLHFISGICEPYDVPADNKDHAAVKPIWWGTNDILENVRKFKSSGGSWDLPLKDMLDCLNPLFRMNYYLPRSILASLNRKEMEEAIQMRIFPAEICAAAVYYYQKKLSSQYLSPEEKILNECKSALLGELQEYFLPDTLPIEKVENEISHWWLSYNVALDLATDAMYSCHSSEGVIDAAHIYLHCASVYDQIMQIEGVDMVQTRQQLDYITAVTNFQQRIWTWVDSRYCGAWDGRMESNITAWNMLFVEKLQSETVRNLWNDFFKEKLDRILSGEVCTCNRLMSSFVRIYCEKNSTYKISLQSCLNPVVFKAIEKGYNIDMGGLRESGKRVFGELVSDMFVREWIRFCPNQMDETNEKIFMFSVTWSPFEHFVKKFYIDEALREILKESCWNMLKQAVEITKTYVEALDTGIINIGIVRMLQQKADTFSTLVQEIFPERKEMKEWVLKALHIRNKEVEAFLCQAGQMSFLTELCQHCSSVDIKDIDIVLQKSHSVEKHVLSEFCKPCQISDELTQDKFRPTVCAFGVSEACLRSLPELGQFKRSSVFMSFWCSTCGSTLQNQCTTVEEVVANIFVPVRQKIQQFVTSVTQGTLYFQQMETMVGNLFKDDRQAMVDELKLLGVKESVAKERIKQLTQYRRLGSCVKGAVQFLRVQVKYQLEGNFQQIKAIALHQDKDFRMSTFDETLMDACAFLEDVTPKRTKCLAAFVQSSALVNWLKETMSKVNELKVFVDLAFMSAGDEPLKIKKVQCLHSAVTGYAPLIFDLKTSSGYIELLDTCKIVWKELNTNENLPDQLIDTCKELEWLKDVKKAHGSVEVTSLVQAEAINECGIYSVGHTALKETVKGGQQKDGYNFTCSRNAMKLVVREKGERKQKHYSFSQLQDLQSRLMLVAGKAEKGNDSVDRFTMIFDGITRLCKVYAGLCEAGCVLFKDWSAVCLCDPSRPVPLLIKFGHGEDVPSIQGRKSKSEDVKELIPRLAKFMETCLDEWLQHIKAMRRKYIHLNYFTVDQLVILQRELVKLGTDTEPTHLIYPLLSAAKENCSPDDIVHALVSAQDEINRETAVGEDDVDDLKDVYDDKMDSEARFDEKRQKFIQEIVQTGYSEALAIKALDYVEPEEVSQGIVWCMEFEDRETIGDDGQNTAEREESEVERDSQINFSGWCQSDVSVQSVITSNMSGLGKQSDSSATSFINDLLQLWKQFLESISSKLQDYLSLEHLGLILLHLSRRDSRKVDRTLPPGFVESQPNLIVCRSGDALHNTLSLYMMDQDQPLPQADEILMCTEKTSRDEVEIFWRRALFEGGRKIHCLVYADLLDYDVSEAAGQCLEQYLQEFHNHADLQYRLIVICSTDNEYRSTIVSSLDKFKRQTLPINKSYLRDYLASKLSVHQQIISGIRPAALVDYNRSSVRVIKSWRAGVGKTLFKQRKVEELKFLTRNVEVQAVSIALHEKAIDIHCVTQRLLEHTKKPGKLAVSLFHFDIAHEVQYGVDYLLFNLIILGCLTDNKGFVWRKLPTDMYLIEAMPIMVMAADRKAELSRYVHPVFDILPDVICRSPLECLIIYSGARPELDFRETDQLFDEKQFRSPVFQRPFQYLLRLEFGRKQREIRPNKPKGNPAQCLQILLRHCGIKDPSWSELHHFVWFLNTQLEDFEQNNFVGVAAAEDLPGFSDFVLRFLIQMSRDFSTRSLNMSEQSPGRKQVQLDIEPMEMNEDGRAEGENDLRQYQMRRTWESSPHPYLFFNSDRFTFTFLGFFIDRANGNLIDQQTRTVLERGIMAQNLYDALVRNHAPLQEKFDDLPRDRKIMKLCNVMGIEFPHDPDDTYELTTDNVKKILAIYMRFRCNIPVIIMGETGCGKTRLIKFMCSLQMPPGLPATNMILMKVHGGTTNQDIIRKVHEAEKIAKKNRKKHGKNMYTVLFFDEANTTEAIGLIKEIMCDRSMEGEELKLCENLKMVAACNPYRKHSDELIKKLEQAGLGYHVDADETTDRLGRLPMRRLVYRVQPLPQSLLPLVWDFGQLETDTEDLYIRQMVKRYIRDDSLPDIPGLIKVVSSILTASQYYMREQKDECSFVSLRDVDRVLIVMSWFYEKSQGARTLFDLMDDKLYNNADDEDKIAELKTDSEEEWEEGESSENGDRIDDITRSLILALGVCYHACLKNRQEYRLFITRRFRAPCQITGGAEQIRMEIECCQDVFLDHVHLEENIARNMALKENVFMMAVCIELRIPLFLVGKPGSSKSLAKTIVSDAMQGNTSRENFFREMKQAQMVSFQCSPLSTPDGIVGTFRQCAQFQKDKDLNTFVSIVVLDEVGLAEDSPRMPLKTLHPLLEDGCQGDEVSEDYMKVAFIGLSNWALDPAKMNRGIIVQREVPDLEELKNSAIGICQTNDNFGYLIKPLIEPMAVSYLDVFKKASDEMREFFGLRDFYSLVKMVFRFVEKSKQKPTWFEMVHAIKRNFGGLDQVNPVEAFRKNLTTIPYDEKPRPTDPDCSPSGLIQACLFDTNEMHSESRYLLLLTENYGALTIIQQLIMSRGNDIRPIVIFGSSFRSDQEYTQVCRNINKIKICMETGKAVVLLNLENLYESLYDALNQYYVKFGGERYVDLGLGTHRVKCPVHENFRLIVVAEKQTVYDKFPIPLINRLEKHFLTINTMLTAEQQDLVNKLEDWIKLYVTQKGARFCTRGKPSSTRVGDVFIGYHDDTCSAVILHVFGEMERNDNITDGENEVLTEAKSVLLWCATPDSVLRLKNSTLPDEEQQSLEHVYYSIQEHENLMQYLSLKIVRQKCEGLFSQVTTHSRLLANVHKAELSTATGIPVNQIMLLESLSSFDTEQQFSGRIHQHLQSTNKDPSLMIIQCDSGDTNINLIASARYCVLDELEKMRDDIRAAVHVAFIIQLPRKAQFQGFQCGVWHSVHIDDLFPEGKHMLAINEMKGKSVANLLTEAVDGAITNEADNEFPSSGKIGLADIEDDTRSHAADAAAFLTTPQELRLNDVLTDLRNTGRGRNQSSYSRLNMKGLILSCVQAALANVKDKVENSRRETDRVALLLKLLHHETEGDISFLHGVCCLIAKLLKEKETKTNVAYLAQDWLINEAADLDHISKTGTFRRSCSQILESKVAPIFAGIIAFLDTNNNLNILHEDQLSWKKDLWLAFLNTQEALHLQYTDLLSPKRQIDLKEVVVMTTGCEGHIFSSRMPFSWLLINKISEILNIHQPEKDLSSKREISVRALSNLPLCRVLVFRLQENMYEEVAAEYIHDFVHCMYHAGTEDEHQFVCQIISNAAYNMLGGSTDSSLLNVLVCIHLVYQTLASRLTYFRAMNSVWPECSTAIVEMKTKNPDHFMFSGEDFTYSGVCLLIENLSPSKVELDEPVGRAKWMNKVHQYRPVVEKLISSQNEDENLDEAQSIQSANRAKRLWRRITVVKLFLEHVCVPGKKERISIKYCMPLWKIMGEDTDLKEIGSFDGVERFLKLCNRSAIKEYMGAEVKCSQCDTVVEGPPVTLPCSDALCDECYEDMKALGEYECAKCHQHFQEGLHLKRQTLNLDAFDKLNDYQKRCNTFFMDVVSQLCFADNTAPSQAVITKLLGYIFFKTRKEQQRTKDLSVFGTGIDPTPVFRSFLLQLLIKTSEETVKEHLENYLQQAHGLIQRDADQNQEEHYVELSLLVIQCLEDMFIQRANTDNLNKHQYVSKALQRARQAIEAQDLGVDKLYGIAYARMGLAEAAKLVADIVLNEMDPRTIPRTARKVVEAAQILCEDTNVRWTRIYLVKCICRCYGIDVYQTICRSHIPFLRWIPITDIKMKQVVEVSDRYIVCGEKYVKIRESLTKIALGENIELLEETLQEMLSAGIRVEPVLQLAIHREITGSYLYPTAQRKVTPQVIEKMDRFIDECKAVKNKDFGRTLVHNKLSPAHLVNVEGDDLRTQGIKCLAVHFMSTMSQLKGDKTLLQPLMTLMKKPQVLANAFLPTMPQDDLQDVRDALLAARHRARGADDNPVFYRCPNGHPYIIGDCGRPAFVGSCKDCGAAIGGQGYQLQPGNVQDHGRDRTMTGHIIGRSENRGKGPVTERTMTPVQCSTIRLILHMAMYIGSSTNPQGVCSLITPDIEVTEVEEFLWRHILRDIGDIHRSLGRSVDDALIFAHNIIDSILRTHNEGEHVRGELSSLASKRGRNQWEIEFAARYLQATIQDIDNVLKSNNQHLAKDKRLGADPLLCLLYETNAAPKDDIKETLKIVPNKQPDLPRLWKFKIPVPKRGQGARNKRGKTDESVLEIQEIPRVWRYRTPVSLQHLRQELDAKIGGQANMQYTVLKLFLKEEHNLRALRYIPSILRLQRTLLHKFQKKLDKAEAAQITVAQLRKDSVLGYETETMIQEFANAWDLARDNLQHYLCPTELGGMMVPKEYCIKSINDKTTLAMLLPTTKEGGLCSYALLDFLMRKQNDFLRNYLKETQRDISSVTIIPPSEVTSAHLISYVPEHDLLPLILANCQYSFEMGKGTKIEYDFAGLERQLMDRFLFSKSRIDVGRTLQIDMMVYRTEFTTATVFKNLADKIPQAYLSVAEKTQICSELKSLPDICQSLDNLDITISFLKTTGGEPDQNMHEFMMKTLQMESSVQSPKAQQVCQFQHVRSLWLLLSLQKSKKMTDSQQHSMSIFENVTQEFHEEPPKELVTALKGFMRKLTVEKQSQIVEVLHEFILLVVSERQNKDDDEFLNTTEHRLGEWFTGYVEGLDNATVDAAVLVDFPSEIQYKHSIHTWIAAYKNMRENCARFSKRL